MKINFVVDYLRGLVNQKKVITTKDVLDAVSRDLSTLNSSEDLPLSGVTAGIYGSASNIPQITIDPEGRITLAANIGVAPSLLTAIGNTSTINLTNTLGTLTADVNLASITYADIQNVTSGKLLGRATAGVGSAEEITLGTNLSFTGTTLNATFTPTPLTLTATEVGYGSAGSLLTGDSNFTWDSVNKILLSKGSIIAGDVGGVYSYAMGAGVGTLGFNSFGYNAGVNGYGALMQLAPSTGAFTMFLESNVSAGAAHSHTITLSWDNTGKVNIPVGLTLGKLNTTLGNAGLYGSTSGLVTIQPNATAGTWTWEIPSAVPSANGYALTALTTGVSSWTLINAGLLTGYVSASGTVGAGDSILAAIQKLNGNIGLLAGSIIYQGTWNANTNTPTLASGVGTKGYYYKVGTGGTISIDGHASWNAGDSIIFDGTMWDKLDGIDTEVLSVFGRVGAVVGAAADYSGVAMTGITSLNGLIITANTGVITTGTWNATRIALGYLDASSGTANHVLMSGASASPTWSTPTFPNASATSGKIIISDGTNWIASTTTEPNSATTGDLLYASAANTYSNLAAVATGYLLGSQGTSTAPAWLQAATLNTSLTTPLLIGGTGTTSVLSLQSTSGVGTVNSWVKILSGNNGATENARAGIVSVSSAGATGGTITTSGGYTIHTFTTSGTFTPGSALNIDYLVVAGGGGGGGCDTANGGAGGGGAGGFLTNSTSVSAAPYTITVGTGGAGGINTNNGVNGNNSSISGGIATATGGGGGGYTIGSAGGSGGGGGGGGSGIFAGGSGTGGQGNGGGIGTDGSYPGGGGGGANAAGANATTSHGGNGGNGTSSSISGAAVTYAGGGGGGIYNTGTNQGTGGTGGGGAGGVSAGSVILNTGVAGTANTGGGGGGGGQSGFKGVGGAGGSGIVIIRYLSAGNTNYPVLGINNTSPTAQLHLGAGSAIANTAPLKFTSGTNLSVTEAGAIEYDGTYFYATPISSRLSFLLAPSTIDLTATGGTSRFLKQNSVGGALTVTQPASTDLSDYVAPTDMSATTKHGWSSYTGNAVQYLIVGKLLTIQFFIEGPGSGTAVDFALPGSYKAINITGLAQNGVVNNIRDNGAATTYAGTCYILPNTSVVTIDKDASYNPAAWSSSTGTRTVYGFIQILIQ